MCGFYSQTEVGVIVFIVIKSLFGNIEKLTLENENHKKIETIINDISRSGISFTFDGSTPEKEKTFFANIEGENNEIEIPNIGAIGEIIRI